METTEQRMESTEQRTVGQIERELSQKIQALYKKHLGQQPSKVSCQLFSRKLVVVLEDSVTQPEKLLFEEGQLELAEKVRTDLNEAMQPQIKTLVEEILGVDVLDLLCDAAIETGRIGIIVVLSDAPKVRNPEAIPKLKK
ncbi:hypothetical protein S7335_2472 [Synechococcus sp. PCC 7335]|uniref:DUF2294 domain-containing protein n=1 Tax=Synechococcus sp. (strain ATCC 29403 / PCC 7335) TaxID=91464 RepID=UPI00017ED8D4|nr:DUF2294 domain-containing protein [Synechococcus sp. PCC 7335]EDX84775.1 hypothetical protein S7335_2472 [Synechococcus sp. PCC 7335]